MKNNHNPIKLHSEDIEYLKTKAYTYLAKNSENEEEGFSLYIFELLTYIRWSQFVLTKVELHLYRRHYIRELIRRGEKVANEVKSKYTPTKGKLKIPRGGTGYYPEGVPNNLLVY